MAVNKVQRADGTVEMDITDTTAIPEDVALGEVFYDKSGTRRIGSGNYMDKVSNPTADNILVTDENGQAIDSGVSLNDVDNVFLVTYDENGSGLGSTPYTDVYQALINEKDILFRLATSPNQRYQPSFFSLGPNQTVVMRFIIAKNFVEYKVASDETWTKTIIRTFTDVDDLPSQATDGTLGTVKTNPSQNITLNANGQLEVGGRIGQFEGTTGLFAPNNREPRNVLDYSLLITDALGMDMSANRSLADVSGYGLACKSAAAGSTQYRISNTYANRILVKLCEGGYASRDEATSKVEQIIPVMSVKIGGASYTPDSSANDSSNDIVITTAQTLNPDSAITNIRLFGKMQSYASLHVGNGIKSESGGRSLVLGGGVAKVSSVNDNCLVGNGIYSSGNGVAAFGRYHILRKNRGFFAGTGHDSTNAPSEGASAIGQYSFMDSHTLFAVGNGSSHTDRKNAFEVRDDGIVLRSPNGTRYKLVVDDSGNLSTAAIT